MNLDKNLLKEAIELFKKVSKDPRYNMLHTLDANGIERFIRLTTFILEFEAKRTQHTIQLLESLETFDSEEIIFNARVFGHNNITIPKDLCDKYHIERGDSISIRIINVVKQVIKQRYNEELEFITHFKKEHIREFKSVLDALLLFYDSLGDEITIKKISSKGNNNDK